MTDNIKPEHYRKGEIDLYEAFSQIFPHNEYRAGMQMIAMRYMFRDKIDRVEDLGKAIYTLERLKEKEIEHAKKNTKTPEEAIVDFGKTLGNVTSELFRNKEDSESIYLLKGFLRNGFKYLARNFDGDVWIYQFPPIKRKTTWYNNTLGSSVSEKIDDHSFPEVNWTDDEPTKISDLLASYENSGENGK